MCVERFLNAEASFLLEDKMSHERVREESLFMMLVDRNGHSSGENKLRLGSNCYISAMATCVA